MLALVAFAMVFVNLVVYASNWFYAIGYGYILLAVEVFALYIFNHVVKIVYNIKDVKGYVQKYLPAPKENGKAQNVKPAEIKEKSKVSKAANNNVSSKAKQSNDSNIPLSDNNIEVVNNSPEIVTGEKE